MHNNWLPKYNEFKTESKPYDKKYVYESILNCIRTRNALRDGKIIVNLY